MGFLFAWCEHLNRGLIGVDHALGQHMLTQRIDQRLELHTGLSDPLRQCRTGDGQSGPTKIFSCRYSGKWSANFATITWAKRPAVGMPLSITWAGTGAWISVSH